MLIRRLKSLFPNWPLKFVYSGSTVYGDFARFSEIFFYSSKGVKLALGENLEKAKKENPDMSERELFRKAEEMVIEEALKGDFRKYLNELNKEPTDELYDSMLSLAKQRNRFFEQGDDWIVHDRMTEIFMSAYSS